MTAIPNLENSNEGPAALWASWFDAADGDAGDLLRELLADLDNQVRARGPTCWTSGRCCNFDAYGHRLYVTGLEIAWVLSRLDVSPPESSAAQGSSADSPSQTPRRLPILSAKTMEPDAQPLPAACPYQVDKLCSIHAIRPMGCRVFFCQEGTSQWQNQLYEEFLGRLRSLHDQRAIPYRYMEWRAGLREALAHRP